MLPNLTDKLTSPAVQRCIEWIQGDPNLEDTTCKMSWDWIHSLLTEQALQLHHMYGATIVYE